MFQDQDIDQRIALLGCGIAKKQASQVCANAASCNLIIHKPRRPTPAPDLRVGTAVIRTTLLSVVGTFRKEKKTTSGRERFRKVSRVDRPINKRHRMEIQAVAREGHFPGRRAGFVAPLQANSWALGDEASPASSSPAWPSSVTPAALRERMKPGAVVIHNGSGCAMFNNETAPHGTHCHEPWQCNARLTRCRASAVIDEGRQTQNSEREALSGARELPRTADGMYVYMHPNSCAI